jgi:type I restriction enzyme R subunit
MYDDGAQIDDVQDVNVVYEVKETLDAQGLYESEDLKEFKEARFKTIRDITHAQEPQHKALYAATERPTRLFNQRLKMLRDAIGMWEVAYEKAHSTGDDAAMKSADHHRREHADQIKTLIAFKSGLGRFVRTYAYIAQLVDFGDPELENYAAFVKLLQKRLNGESPESVDLKGLVLTGFDIKRKDDVPADEDQLLVLQPIGPGSGGSKGEDPHYLAEIIDRLNRLFGEATPLRDQATFVNHIVAIARENDVVMAQVENNTREQALKGNLPGAVQQGVVRALTSHQKLATLVLKSDRQSMGALTDMIYELIRDRKDIDMGGHGA